MANNSTACWFKFIRLLSCCPIVITLWACNPRKLVPPTEPPAQVGDRTFVQSLNRKLDLLFVIDNSFSMAGSQMKLGQRLPDFMDALTNIPGGAPDLHLAVVSSSLGAGKFGNAPDSGCPGGYPKDGDGNFVFANRCAPPVPATLDAGHKFIKSGPGGKNFTGTLADMFRCIALIGADGCGFEQQFASMRLALEKASRIDNPDNGGFLRDDAYLAVVMLTNEDDCSVPYDSELFDPSKDSLADPLGTYQSYRCNEFGHLCDGVPPPHHVATPTTLHNCVPANEKGRLTPVSEFVTFLKNQIGKDQEKIFVAALTGPTGPPYVVEMSTNDDTTPLQMSIRHSCRGSGPKEYADPALRVKSWVDAFGDRGEIANICEDDYGATMRKIAAGIGRLLEPACLPINIRNRTDSGLPDCQVAEVVGDVLPGTAVPFCGGKRTKLPCWELVDEVRCGAAKVLRICRDTTCDVNQVPTDERYAKVSCSLMP